MVDPGRSEVEDSDGGGLDGRWSLIRENRRLKASVAGDDRDLFPARWGGENDENHRGFSLQQGRNLSVVVRRLETAGYRRSEIGGERESHRREERDALRVATVWTRAWYTGTAEHCAPLDLGWNDRPAVIGWICRLIGRSGWAEVLIRCCAVYRKLGTPSDVAQRNQILNFFQRLRCVGICLVFLNLFF